MSSMEIQDRGATAVAETTATGDTITAPSVGADARAGFVATTTEGAAETPVLDLFKQERQSVDIPPELEQFRPQIEQLGDNLNEEQLNQVIIKLTNIIAQSDAGQLAAPELNGHGREIVASILRNVGQHNVHQGNKNTCSVTVIENDLANYDAANYVSVVADLSVYGSATLLSGETIDLYSRGDLVADDGRPPRGLASIIFQASVMQYGLDSGYVYVNSTDLVHGPNSEVLQGLASHEWQRAYHDVLNVSTELKATTNRGSRDGISPDAAIDLMQEDLAAQLSSGQAPPPTVYTEMQWSNHGSHTFHMIEVARIDENPDGSGLVYIVNPWNEHHGDGPSRQLLRGSEIPAELRHFGKVEVMDLALFKQRVTCIADRVEGDASTATITDLGDQDYPTITVTLQDGTTREVTLRQTDRKAAASLRAQGAVAANADSLGGNQQQVTADSNTTAPDSNAEMAAAEQVARLRRTKKRDDLS